MDTETPLMSGPKTLWPIFVDGRPLRGGRPPLRAAMLARNGRPLVQSLQWTRGHLWTP